MMGDVDIVRLAIDLLIGGSTVVLLLRRIFRAELKTALVPLVDRVEALEAKVGITGPMPTISQAVAGE